MTNTNYTENEQLVYELWKCFNELRFDDAYALLHENFTAEWP